MIEANGFQNYHCSIRAKHVHSTLYAPPCDNNILTLVLLTSTFNLKIGVIVNVNNNNNNKKNSDNDN